MRKSSRTGAKKSITSVSSGKKRFVLDPTGYDGEVVRLDGPLLSANT